MWGIEVVVHSRLTGLAVVDGAAIEFRFCPIDATLRHETTEDAVNALVGAVAELVVDSVVGRRGVDSVVDPLVDTIVIDSVVDPLVDTIVIDSVVVAVVI